MSEAPEIVVNEEDFILVGVPELPDPKLPRSKALSGAGLARAARTLRYRRTQKTLGVLMRVARPLLSRGYAAKATGDLLEASVCYALAAALQNLGGCSANGNAFRRTAKRLFWEAML